MAVVKKGAPAAPAAKPAAVATAVPAGVAFASNLPSDMMQGGLKDDFDGVIRKARYVPWDYNGNLDHHILAVVLTIQPEGEEAFEQHYSAGDLDNFVPSDSAGNAVDLQNGEGEALEGTHALRIGKKEQMSQSSNWAQFVGAALDAGFPQDRVSIGVNFIEGTVAHFNRIPQKKRSGIVSQAAADPNKKRSNDILVITEFKGFEGGSKAPAPKAPTASAATTTAAPAATASSGGDLDAQIVGAILPAVRAAGEDGLQKAKLPQLVLNSLTGAAKAKGVKRVADEEFLSNRDEFAYDPETGTLYAV